MKKRVISSLLILFVLPFSLLCGDFSMGVVSIENEAGTVLISYRSPCDITDTLQKAFDYTGKNSSKDNPLTIRIEQGSYKVGKTLRLSSYTILDLGSSKLINTNKGRGNIFKSPDDKEYSGYSSLTNCVIKNGTLDGNYNPNKSCILRLCHSNDILIQNVDFINNYYSHHTELAACKNVHFDNCKFYGQVSDLNVSSSEAIQIDILDKVHFCSFTSYDNTMNTGIVVSNCYFKNVCRGVGTHNYFKNLYQTDITVVGCTFENITDCAISAVNFKTVSFKNNNYINCKNSVFWCDNGE